ncbi:MAG: rhodanese-like domain-containing protein [Planctomycetes bacterium]|nr:rhodanese-like domain-containing protein [Planctomycetota bacterium]
MTTTLKVILGAALIGAGVAVPAAGEDGSAAKDYPKAKVSFDDYKTLVAEVESHRRSRLIDLDTFLAMSREEGVIVLDCRSDFRYERIHVKGAKHLAFTEFTEKNLAAVIPAHTTKILIYCNNNFAGEPVNFASKVAPPRPRSGQKVASQFAAEAKPLMMALNIPTFIALYGYGYHDVYELDELVNVTDPRITFEGTVVEQTTKAASAAPAPPLAKLPSPVDDGR